MASALTDEARTFRVIVLHPTRWQKVLYKLKISRRYKEFKMKPLVLGKMVDISRLMIEIDTSGFTKNNIYEKASRLVISTSAIFAEIVAIAVCESRKPSKSDIKFLYDNLSVKQIAAAAGAVMQQNDLTSFLSGIASIKGVNILEANPEVVEESLASTESLEAS